MAQFQNDELEYVDGYYDVVDFDDTDAFADNQLPGSHDADSDFDHDDFDESKAKTDTSAMEARNGKDIQGIPWERLNFTRDRYRETRLKQYKNYENLSRPRQDLEKECLPVETGKTFYDFHYNTRIVKSTIVHFQLRNLLWATSKHDVYVMQNFSVMHWSSLLRRGKEVLNVAKPVVPTEKRPGLVVRPLSRVQISTMAVKENLLVAGGFQGELICKAVGSLKGHLDYCFSSAWHPNGQILATGNQDTTCRLWDIRNLSESVAVLKGRMGAIRAINFTSDGRFMAMAEPADFVHILDTQCGYVKEQEIDLFGEIAGISFSPDTEALFVGIADRTYGSVLELDKRHRNQYLEAVF